VDIRPDPEVVAEEQWDMTAVRVRPRIPGRIASCSHPPLDT
jgi:hypothetical protein